MSINSRNVKAFLIHAEDIAALLAGQAICSAAVPPDATVVRYAYQWETNSAIIIMGHRSFEEVPLGGDIPIFTVTTRLI